MAAHRVFSLHGRQTTVMIEASPGEMPVWRYFGPTLRSAPAIEAWRATDIRALPPASIDRRDGIPLFPGEGNGLRCAPALSMHRNGRDWVHECVLTACDDSTPGQLRLSLADATAGIAVDIVLTLAADADALRVQSTLRNTGDAPLDVLWLAAASIALPSAVREMATFTGQWAHEFQWQRTPLPPTGWERINRCGRTSHAGPPACFLLSRHCGEYVGAAWAAMLAWSGNHRLSVLPTDHGSFCLQAGEWLAPGEVVLAPGASLSSPELVVAHSSAGIDGASNALHRHVRRDVLCWPEATMRPRPVHLNTWEAVYFNHDPAVLMELAESAARIGIERFVLDDGWFEGRHDDTAALGDWWPDPAKYPDGLDPLIRRVRELGMEFGLWVEPEMVNPHSQLYRAHPEWALQIAGRPPMTGRNQLVLDIARPEVSDYLFDKLDALLSRHEIAYFKWDMNRDLAQAGGADGRAAYRRQVNALYALLARLRVAHPAVEIESCASGGGRADYGVLRHTHRLWLSDNNDAVSRVRIQSGALRFFPPELCGSHVGPAPAHTTGRGQSLAFRCAVAMFGHMGVESDVRHLDEAERTELAQWIDFHKSVRDTLHRGSFCQGESETGLVWWLAMDSARAVLGVFRTTPPDDAQEPALPLPAFARSENWRVTLARCVGKVRAHGSVSAPLFDALLADGAVFSGDELACAGLPLPTMNPESALIYVFERRSA